MIVFCVRGVLDCCRVHACIKLPLSLFTVWDHHLRHFYAFYVSWNHRVTNSWWSKFILTSLWTASLSSRKTCHSNLCFLPLQMRYLRVWKLATSPTLLVVLLGIMLILAAIEDAAINLPLWYNHSISLVCGSQTEDQQELTGRFLTGNLWVVQRPLLAHRNDLSWPRSGWRL